MWMKNQLNKDGETEFNKGESGVSALSKVEES